MRRLALRLVKLPPRIIYAVGLGRILGHFVLLLTTRGRRTGRPRVTPLQYEEIDDTFVVASARGTRADWYRNLVVDPTVAIRVGRSRVTAIAEPTTDRGAIADLLEFRLERHPCFVGTVLRLRGVPRQPERRDLEAYAGRLAMVTLAPRR
jgi:deazaflavin-dependent oxidoreductase (nitroreductase family)